MTREEAIEEVKNYENYPNGLSKECREYIIKALEQETVSKESYDHEYFLRKELEMKIAKLEQQEPILDKIRAEIEQQERWLMNAGYNAYNVGIAFNAIKLVVDKYKGESEE